MLKITPDAWNRLRDIQSTRPELKAVRLRIVNGLLKCHKGRQQAGDHVIDMPNRTTILMSPRAAKSLADCMLDVRPTKRGPRLRLKKFDHFKSPAE